MSTERYTAKQYLNGEHIRKPKGKELTKSPYRSKLEAYYAEYLETLRLAGIIKGWKHEPEKFQITFGKEPTSYIPDFQVTNLDGSIEWHETKFCAYIDKKGKKRTPKQAKEGLLKLKIARDKYPQYPWYLVERNEQGQWWKTEQ